MTSRLLEQLRNCPAVQLHPGVDASVFVRLEREVGIVLPDDHRSVLQDSNGIEAYDGYIRLFGIYTNERLDSVRWNQHEYWKFAWGERCSAYWCFAETGWGDQYGYSLTSLRNGVVATQVYFLSAFSMTPRKIASSFIEFFETEFVRCAKDPYDDILKKARRKLGRLAAGYHVTYVPTVLLSGVESIENVEQMDARVAMICNGDIAMQLDAGPMEGAVKSMLPYEDEMHRMRIRLVWA